jgi:(S)-ureidoglycine aminohydrolase
MKWSLFLICIASVLTSNAQPADTLMSGPYYWKRLEPVTKGNITSRQILTGRTLALSNFKMVGITLQPGKMQPPPHTNREQDELVIVKEGTVKVTIKGKAKTLSAGSIAFIMAGDASAIVNTGSTPAVFYALAFSGRNPMDLARAKAAGGSFMLDVNELKKKDTEKGYLRDYFNRATAQVAQFEMHTTALNAGEVSHAPHTHIQEEVIVVTRGNVEMQIADNFHEGATGDLFFLSANTPHALKNIGKDQCEYFAFQWRNQ